MAPKSMTPESMNLFFLVDGMVALNFHTLGSRNNFTLIE